jgi:ATP-dependent Lon protease
MKNKIKKLKKEYIDIHDNIKDKYDISDTSEEDNENSEEEQYTSEEEFTKDNSKALKYKKPKINIILSINEEDEENYDEDDEEEGEVEEEEIEEGEVEEETEELKENSVDNEYKNEDKKILKEQKKICSNNIKKFKKFRRLLNTNNNISETKYFGKCNLDKQQSILNNLELITNVNLISEPYSLKLIESNIDPSIKAIALKKVNLLSNMDSTNGEYYKLKQWVDTFMLLPFGNYRYLPVQYSDGLEKCNAYMKKSKQILDDAVYGLNDAKFQFLQLVGQWIANPKSVGTAIAIKGPMGTGKTTLVKEGISKVLGREFSFIALGGATDSSYLEGHSYTYEGSKWGKIVDILITSRSMNPVIFMDELDKVSNTPQGREIIGILTHLTDTTQNSCFRDKYFSEFEFDLSRALFIFSYNDETKINPILKDRMYQVETKGYDSIEKTIIATKYLLPKIRKNIAFNDDDIVITDEVIKYIINNYTNNEKGVRNLKRCLEIIHNKLNLYRLTESNTNLFDKEYSFNVEFPMNITENIVNKLLKNNNTNDSWKNLYL